MVAPTRVNEEAPQEPAAAGGPGPATAELMHAEAVVEDPSGQPGGSVGTVTAESATHPPIETAKSRLNTSPSRST